MQEYERMVSSQRKWMLYLLVILAIGYGVTSFSQVFLGLLLGSSVSLFNMSLLQKKVRAFGETITGNGKVFSLGTFTRFATIGLTIFFALRFKEKVNIGSVIIGLMSSYIVMLINTFISTAKTIKKTERNDKNQHSNLLN